jgi:hypothetical protein
MIRLGFENEKTLFNQFITATLRSGTASTRSGDSHWHHSRIEIQPRLV